MVFLWIMVGIAWVAAVSLPLVRVLQLDFTSDYGKGPTARMWVKGWGGTILLAAASIQILFWWSPWGTDSSVHSWVGGRGSQTQCQYQVVEGGSYTETVCQ